LIGFIVAGLIIGALARLVRPGQRRLGWTASLLLGLAGSATGATIASFLGSGDIFELNVLGFLVTAIATIVLIGTAEAVADRRRGDED
jgi:uncharacterized membrane protein YeaQ/YmgE (transglycosylase-associated protein family)